MQTASVNTVSGPGTWSLAEIAQVKIRGADIPEPGSQEEELILAAWKVYRFMLARALREVPRKEAVQHGRTGFVVTVELPKVYNDVWPAGQQILSSVPNQGDARGKITNWLSVTQNIAVVARGRGPVAVRRGTELPPASSRWWVAEEFRGAPPGMKLPGTESESEDGSRVPDLRDGAETDVTQAVAPDPVTAQDKTWWCPFTHICHADSPLTRRGLGTHMSSVHKIRGGSDIFDLAMEEAEKLRAGRQSTSSLPEPESYEPESEPVLPVMPMPTPMPVLPDTVSQLPARTDGQLTPARQVAGTVAAQARVFVTQIADLESEVARLQGQVYLLQEENSQLRKNAAGQGNLDQVSMAEVRALVLKAAVLLE